MDESTIAEMRARATAAKERIDAVEEGEVDEPEFDEVVAAAAMFANDAAALAEDVDALTAEVERLRDEQQRAMEALGGNPAMGLVEMATRCRDWRRGLLKDAEEAKERASHANVALYDLKIAFDRERDALTSKLASLEPVLEALLCADRQELPRDLADRVTAYVKALHTRR
jgi:hypothetical protein